MNSNIESHSVKCESSCRSPSLMERLEDQKQDLEGRLARLNEALDALKSNPEVAKVIDLVSKV